MVNIIEYLDSSGVVMLAIDSEFQALMPRPTTEEYKTLEQNILKDGCRDTLKLWNGILLDGHIRYEICLKHNRQFKTESIELEDRNEAILWILRNQLGRRNLTDQQRTYYMGMRYELEKWDIGDNQYTRVGQNGTPTRDRLANEYDVSSSTVHRAMKYKRAVDMIAEHSPELKDSILSGELYVPKIDIMQFAAVTRDNPAVGQSAIDELVAGNAKRFKQAIYVAKHGHSRNGVTEEIEFQIFDGGYKMGINSVQFNDSRDAFEHWKGKTKCR